MHTKVIATDYDGTIAHDGVVDAPTIAALEKLRAAQRRLILVTGRELTDFESVMPRLDLFDRVIAENGAVMLDPSTGEITDLCEPPPPIFAERLRAEGIDPLSVGRVIVATWEPNETAVLRVIRELGLELQIIFNKGAVMVLPSGVHKGTGLLHALTDLGFSPLDCVGVGDAENDNAFLATCGLSVAVANALPSLKARATWTTEGERGAGVVELANEIVADDLAALEPDSPLLRVPLAQAVDGGDELDWHPRRDTLLITGASGAGKSTLAFGLLERLIAGGFQVCVIDPEGDYGGSVALPTIGSANEPPELPRVPDLLHAPGAPGVIVNLLGLSIDDRPAFLVGLLPELMSMRAATGRPHVVLIDEAHHMLPSHWDPGDAVLPNGGLDGMIFITVHPDRLTPRVLDAVQRVMIVGDAAAAAAATFCGRRGLVCPSPDLQPRSGEVLTMGVGDPTARVLRVIPGAGTRHRHVRKYAEGTLGEDKSFWFRGPNNALNIRAQNLSMFLQIGDGVDEATWQHHRRAGDFSNWLRDCVKDPALADEVAEIERSDLPLDAARQKLRTAIEARYTAPA